MSLLRNGLAMAALVLAAACQVQKTQEGELPEVKIQGGQLPKYEVKPTESGHVHVRLDTTTVLVPKVEPVPDSARR